MLTHLAQPLNLWHHKIKMSINSAIKSKKGRPAVDSEAVNVRLLVDVLSQIDEWRREQPDIPTRPEAIRRLLAIGLRADHGLHDLLGNMDSIVDGHMLNRGKLENKLRFILHDNSDVV
ncbi:hypothetical protein L614_002000000560 [Ochrobactrum sp. J50]|uniref:hypothetical protein n=1 Tax=Ochrobactrum sp. J50 TaxID=936132 RepID=UPI00119E7A4A|nr:hypothetical protein [Ochrobactrum sp. J50]TWH01822.1 hypothetical protein L614_002000000560 [Ochrobactrum sp. J50]